MSGAYANGTFTAPRAIWIAANGLMQRGRAGVLKLKLTDAGGKSSPQGHVRISGAGIRPLRRTSTKRGAVSVKVRPKRRGNIVSYRDPRTTVRVR